MKRKSFIEEFKSYSKFRKMMFYMLFLMSAYVALPAVILLFVGLLPTITILITDKKNKGKLVSVCCFNLAGMFFFIFKLVDDFSVRQAIGISSGILNLIVMFGCAAVGMLLYYEIPNIFTYFTKINTKNRLKSIDQSLAKIREEWGDEIVNEKIDVKQASKAG